ncbi:MAG: hypothetical protein OXE95_07960 [Chloroflexi bacterium]|nr:hypothetical protein [Chloroflexota bacterium]
MQVNAAGDDPSAPSGWQASPPSGNDPIWVTIQRVERGDTGVMYTTPVRWNGLDGADGVDGTNGLSGSFERALYRANNTAPSAPSSGMLASADNTPSVPANWSTQPPDSVHPVWVVIQRVERGAVAVNYTTPVRWDGERGDDGLAGSFERLLFRAAASAPSAPTNSSLASADDTPALPSNWAAQPPDTNQPVYATFQRVARGATAVTYTTPVRWDGPMGARGMPGGFGLQLIGRTTGSSFQITDRWKNTGIAMPTTREDGELWAIGVNNSIFMFEPDKLFSVNNANQSNAIGIINNSITLQVFNQNRYVRILPMREVFDSPVSPFLPQAVIQLGISGGDAIGSNGFAVGGDILITSYLHSPLNSFTPISIYRVRGFQSGRESHLGTSDVASDVTDTGIVDGRGPFTVPADGDATERIINFTQHPAKTPAGMEVYTSGVNKGKILLPAGRWLLCVGLQMRSSIMNSEVSGVLGIYYDGNLRHPQTIKMNRPENAHRYEGAVSVSGGVVSDGVKLTWIGLSLDTADATNQITLQAGHVHIFEQ